VLHATYERSVNGGPASFQEAGQTRTRGLVVHGDSVHGDGGHQEIRLARFQVESDESTFDDDLGDFQQQITTPFGEEPQLGDEPVDDEPTDIFADEETDDEEADEDSTIDFNAVDEAEEVAPNGIRRFQELESELDDDEEDADDETEPARGTIREFRDLSEPSLDDDDYELPGEDDIDIESLMAPPGDDGPIRFSVPGDLDEVPSDLTPVETDRKLTEERCAEELRKLKASRIADVNLDISLRGTAGKDFPFECTLDTGESFDPRAWSQVTYMWKASKLMHKPLYFEEVALERYGHTWGPCLQPFVSGAHFFGRLPVLPYCMGYTPPCECQYALGYYRPGNCAPYMCPAVPISPRGALMQAGAVVGTAAIIP
jgi:hypothetical protein